MSNETIYKNEVRIYKPRKTNDGAATKLQQKIVEEQYSNKVYIFWVSTKQIQSNNDNAAFAWNDQEKEISMKLEAVDLSQILSTLHGITKETKLFHKHSKGNSILTISKVTNTSYIGQMNVKISKQIAGKVSEVKHSLTAGEVEILKIVFADAISTIYGW